MTLQPNKARGMSGKSNHGLRTFGRNNELAADPEDRDIVIPFVIIDHLQLTTLNHVVSVMGPSGAGKSTFINAVLGQNAMVVGYEIESCTSDITSAEVDTSKFLRAFPWLKNRRLLLIDTPGFDDTYKDDSNILKSIAKWLKTSYNTQVLGGVIYLHDISQDRFTGTARRNLSMFNRLCGQGALEKVVLGATKSSRLVPEEALKRLTRLNDVHWKDMIDAKAQVFEFDGGHISALELLKAILNRFGDTIALQIQDELVNKRMIIPETAAGKELRYTLEQVRVEFQHIAKLSGNAKEGDTCAEADLLEARKKIEMLSQQLQQLKVPFSRRFLTFFNLQ